MKKIIGLFLVSSPFLAIIAWILFMGGIKFLLIMIGVMVVLGGVILLGVHLLKGDQL